MTGVMTICVRPVTARASSSSVLMICALAKVTAYTGMVRSNVLSVEVSNGKFKKTLCE